MIFFPGYQYTNELPQVTLTDLLLQQQSRPQYFTSVKCYAKTKIFTNLSNLHLNDYAAIPIGTKDKLYKL